MIVILHVQANGHASWRDMQILVWQNFGFNQWAHPLEDGISDSVLECSATCWYLYIHVINLSQAS